MRAQLSDEGALARWLCLCLALGGEFRRKWFVCVHPRKGKMKSCFSRWGMLIITRWLRVMLDFSRVDDEAFFLVLEQILLDLLFLGYGWLRLAG